MKKNKAYLFDFDGTLVDTMGGFADIAGRVINQFHPEISIEEARAKYLETSGVPFFQQLEIILPDDPTNKKKAEIFEETKKEGFFMAEFSDEVKSTITELRSRGAIVGVASNNFQNLIDEFISKGGLEFDVVLGFRDGFEKGKDHFQYIMKKYSLSNDELIFIGDSLKDADKAVDNNIRFVGLCGTFTREEFIKKRSDIQTIDSIKELLEI